MQSIKDKAQQLINAIEAAERRLLAKELYGIIKGLLPLLGIPVLPTNYGYDHSQAEADDHIDGLSLLALGDWGSAVHAWAVQQEEI